VQTLAALAGAAAAAPDDKFRPLHAAAGGAASEPQGSSARLPARWRLLLQQARLPVMPNAAAVAVEAAAAAA
jgi:hypothetical protein